MAAGPTRSSNSRGIHTAGVRHDRPAPEDRSSPRCVSKMDAKKSAEQKIAEFRRAPKIAFVPPRDKSMFMFTLTGEHDGTLWTMEVSTFPRGEGAPATAGAEEERRYLSCRWKPVRKWMSPVSARIPLQSPPMAATASPRGKRRERYSVSLRTKLAAPERRLSPKPPLCKGRCVAQRIGMDDCQWQSHLNSRCPAGAEGLSIPQSASLTAPFTQGSLGAVEPVGKMRKSALQTIPKMEN